MQQCIGCWMNKKGRTIPLMRTPWYDICSTSICCATSLIHTYLVWVNSIGFSQPITALALLVFFQNSWLAWIAMWSADSGQRSKHWSFSVDPTLVGIDVILGHVLLDFIQSCLHFWQRRGPLVVRVRTTSNATFKRNTVLLAVGTHQGPSWSRGGGLNLQYRKELFYPQQLVFISE